MKTRFNTLNPTTTYSYDATTVADQNKVAEFKHYYNYNKSSKTMEKIAPLEPCHFASKLYKDVLEGSMRWWLIELRKYDHEFIRREEFIEGDRLPVKKVLDHEAGWIKMVEDWYNRYESNLDSTCATFGEAGKTTQYQIYSKLSDKKILSLNEACRIGYNEYNEPKFYKVTTDLDGGEFVECNITSDSSSKCTRLSEVWWVLERMRYDRGDRFHPVAPDFGMVAGDWKGVVYKNHNHLCGDAGIVAYHERGWIQWVNAVYASVYNDMTRNDERVSIDSAFRHNMSVISRLDRKQLDELAAVCPEYIITHMPTTLYKDAILYILNIINAEGRFTGEDRDAVGVLMTRIIPSVKVTPSVPTGCENITLPQVYAALNTINPDGDINIARTIAYKIDQYKMLSTQKASKLVDLLSSLSPMKKAKGEDEEDTTSFDSYCRSKGVEPVDIWSVGSKALTEIFSEADENSKRLRKKFGLK